MVDTNDPLPDAQRVLEVARAAAIEAGELLRGYLGRLQADQIHRKSAARDLVTEADVRSERLLVEPGAVALSSEHAVRRGWKLDQRIAATVGPFA